MATAPALASTQQGDKPAEATANPRKTDTIRVRVKRQDGRDAGSYWQTFHVEKKPNMNVISVLQAIAANPVTVDGEKTTPITYDSGCLEEVCGSCTMLINGRVRQACSALVDQLLNDDPSGIRLEPMTKFPVIRDLFPDRTKMFKALQDLECWVPIDDSYDHGEGPSVSAEEAEERYAYSRCMTCGCCMEACPQYNDHSNFIGPAPIAQAILFNMHPTGASLESDRLDVLAGPAGVTNCGNAQNCVKVCPKEVPLTRAIAKAGRAVVKHKVAGWFRR